MTKDEIYQKIAALIVAQKGEGTAVSLATSLTDEIAEDSVEVMEFILTLEDEFEVEIPDVAIDTFDTVGDIVDFISKNK